MVQENILLSFLEHLIASEQVEWSRIHPILAVSVPRLFFSVRKFGIKYQRLSLSCVPHVDLRIEVGGRRPGRWRRQGGGEEQIPPAYRLPITNGAP